MITQMKALITRRVITVAVLLAAAVTFVFTGMAIENTVPIIEMHLSASTECCSKAINNPYYLD